jgi:hypothetical protein
MVLQRRHAGSIFCVLLSVWLFRCAGNRDPASLRNKAYSYYLKAWKVHQSDHKGYKRTVWLSLDRRVKRIAHKHIDWEYTVTFQYVTSVMDYTFWLKKGVLHVGKMKYRSLKAERYRLSRQLYCQSVDIELSLGAIYTIPLADTLYIALYGEHAQPWNVVLKKPVMDKVIDFIRELEFSESPPDYKP